MEHLVAHGVKLLTARPQSRAELTRKLARVCASRQRSKLARFRQPFEGVDCGSAVAQAIAELERMALVDDSHYAAYHVEQRERFRPRSRLALRGELAAKGVASAIGEAATADVDDAAAALALARRRPRGSDARAVVAFLARKGFAPGVALAAANRAMLEREAAAAAHARAGDDDANGPLR